MSIELTDDEARILFDLIVGTMDFGSGFFEEDDVVTVRKLATLIGVDPMLGTPENLKCRFSGRHDWRYVTGWADGTLWICEGCKNRSKSTNMPPVEYP